MEDGEANAIVGGALLRVGGWGEYEVSRRRERWRATAHQAPPEDERPGSRYKGRTYVGADDVARSVVAANFKRSALRKAILVLAQALEAHEAAADAGAQRSECLGVVMLPITSHDLRQAAADPELGADPGAIQELFESVSSAAPGLEIPRAPTHKLRPGFVDTANDDGILNLEEEVLPCVAELEKHQAAAAAYFCSVAKVLEKSRPLEF